MTDRTIDWVFRATDKTGAAFRSVDSKLAGITKSLRSFAGFAGFAAVAAGIGTLTKDLVQMGSELQDASEKLGVSAEKLQVLKFAAEQTGASFSSLQSALAFNTKLTGNASRGNKEAAESLKLIGIEAKSFVNVPIDQRLSIIANRLAAVQDPATRLEFAIKVLGRGAADLVPLLSQGAAGLAKFEEQLRSSKSILSNEQVKALDDAGDAWSAFILRLKVSAAPVLTGTIGLLNDLAAASSKAADKFFDAKVNTSNALQAAALANIPKRVTAGRRGGGRGQGALEDPVDIALRDFGDFTRKKDEKQSVSDRLSGAFDAIKKIGEEQEAASKSAAKAQDAYITRVQKTQEEVEKVTTSIADFSRQSNDYFNAAGRELSESYKAPIDVLTAGVEKVNALFLQGVINADTANAAIQAYGDDYVSAMNRVTEKNEEVKDSTTDLLKEIQVAANGFARDLTDAFFDATQTIGELFEQLAITIAKAIFTQTVTEPLINAILSGINFSGSSSSPGGTSSGGNAPESFSRRAIGGSVMAGSSYLVGERGPELFVPSGGGTIVPNGGSSPVTVNFTITSVDPQTAAQTIASQERLITGMIRRATLRAGRRPQLA